MLYFILALAFLLSTSSTAHGFIFIPPSNGDQASSRKRYAIAAVLGLLVLLCFILVMFYMRRSGN